MRLQGCEGGGRRTRHGTSSRRSRQPRWAITHTPVRSGALARAAEVVAESCTCSGVAGPGGKGWGHLHTQHRPRHGRAWGCRRAGGQGHLGVSRTQESPGWLAARGFTLEGRLPPEWEALGRAWVWGRLLCGPVQGPRVHLQPWRPLALPSWAEMGLRGRRCGSSLGAVGRAGYVHVESAGSATR